MVSYLRQRKGAYLLLKKGKKEKKGEQDFFSRGGKAIVLLMAFFTGKRREERSLYPSLTELKTPSTGIIDSHEGRLLVDSGKGE